MKIQSAEFMKSAVKPSQYPEHGFPEIAFAGRSNVGKSSLINTLVKRKSLVKTSSKPGCTQLINFFLLNQDICLVDLPGYGYAKVSKSVRAQWQPMVERYLSSRKNLCGLVLLMDLRRDPREEEAHLMDFLEASEIPYLIILTKADKLSKNQQKKRLAALSAHIRRHPDDMILFSSKTGLGRQIVLDEIAALLHRDGTSFSDTQEI